MSIETRNKFGITPSDEVTIIDAPPIPLDLIVRIAPTAVFTLQGRFDVVILFAMYRADVERLLPSAVQALRKDGRLWTMYHDPLKTENADLAKERGWSALVRDGYAPAEYISFGDWFGIRWSGGATKFGRR